MQSIKQLIIPGISQQGEEPLPKSVQLSRSKKKLIKNSNNKPNDMELEFVIPN